MTDKDKKVSLDHLTEEQYYVTQQKGTEAPFSGEYDQFFKDGTYRCVVCNKSLFKSEDKFNAGCGWPSFSQPIEAQALTEHDDLSLPNRPRTEVVCQHCGAHLGHVFSDGPAPTGMRYCINSAALNFEKED